MKNQKNKKRLLILGANPETVSLVLKAKEMGYYTIVTDNNPDAFAKGFADKSFDINAVDAPALVELAKKENIDGVLVGVAEALLPTYCEVCEALGFPAYSNKEVFETMVRKDYFKNACRKNGVPTIVEYTMDKPDEIRYPVIVKPTDSCSSKGITICYNEEELLFAIDYAKQFSLSKTFVIEKYMTGDEVISYYVIQNGNPIFVGICDRYTYKSESKKVQLPISYIFPSKYFDSYLEHSDEPIKEMMKNIGLKNGSIFFQCFVDEDGIVRTYEPGFRLNGAQEHIVLSKVSGIDAKELYINYALTGSVSQEDLSALANPKHKEFCCKLSPLIKTGTIGEIGGLEMIEQLPDVVSVNPSYREGDTVTGEGTLKQIVCRFFIVSRTKESLAETIRKIQANFHVLNEKNENMLLGKFDTNIIEKNYK